MLRFLFDNTANSDEVPEPAVFSGLANVCEDIERLVRRVREALDVEVLGTELTRRR